MFGYIECLEESQLLQLSDLFNSFQLNHKPTDKASCPLCRINLTMEQAYYENDKILIVDTYERKGHKNRIMVLTKEHGILQ